MGNEKLPGDRRISGYDRLKRSQEIDLRARWPAQEPADFLSPRYGSTESRSPSHIGNSEL